MCCIVSGFMADLEAECKTVDPDQLNSKKSADMNVHCFQTGHIQAQQDKGLRGF